MVPAKNNKVVYKMYTTTVILKSASIKHIYSHGKNNI